MTGRERTSHYKKKKKKKSTQKTEKQILDATETQQCEGHKWNNQHYVIKYLKWQNKNSTSNSKPRIILLCIGEAWMV